MASSRTRARKSFDDVFLLRSLDSLCWTIVFSDGRIVADEQHPNAEVMNELLMAERERTTRTTLTDTPADQMAQMAGVRNVPDLPITDAPLPPAVPTSGCEGTLRHARAAARHAR